MRMKFIQVPKAKQFHIGTRYYDPKKEAMKEREERIKRELEQQNAEGVSAIYGAGIKGQFRKAGKLMNSKTVAEARRKSNMRLIYIIIILSILFYILLK